MVNYDYIKSPENRKDYIPRLSVANSNAIHNTNSSQILFSMETKFGTLWNHTWQQEISAEPALHLFPTTAMTMQFTYTTLNQL